MLRHNTQEDTLENRYTRIFTTLNQRSVDVYAFRRMVALGKPLAARQSGIEDAALVEMVFTNPKYTSYWLNPTAAVRVLGGKPAIAERMTKAKMATMERAVDVASLVFIHSSLDGALSELCRVAAALRPDAWELSVANQKVTLAQVKASEYDALYHEKLERHLDQLERESLQFRARRLFQLCRPEATFDPIRSYVYDEERLVELDDLRHRLVHGAAEQETLPPIEEALEFLTKTGVYFVLMLSHSYGIKLDPLEGLKLPVRPN